MLLLGLPGKPGFGSSTLEKAWPENLSIRLLDLPSFLIHGFVFDLQSCNLHDPTHVSTNV
jgi:hypothetical protein